MKIYSLSLSHHLGLEAARDLAAEHRRLRRPPHGDLLEPVEAVRLRAALPMVIFQTFEFSSFIHQLIQIFEYVRICAVQELFAPTAYQI